MTFYITLMLGSGLVIYGLSPLAGSHPLEGFVSERGCIAAIFGIAIITLAVIVKVVS